MRAVLLGPRHLAVEAVLTLPSLLTLAPRPLSSPSLFALPPRRTSSPPLDDAGRFDTFVVPLLENLAERRRADRAAAVAADPALSTLDSSHPISAAPDLFVTTPTFWNLMRQPTELPLPSGSWAHELGAWAPPTRERQDWWERRVQEAVEHVASAWDAARGSTKLVWRASPLSSLPRPPSDAPLPRLSSPALTRHSPLPHLSLAGRLHTVYGENKWPVMKVRAQDDVAVRVIELLQQESAAAETSSSWARWTKNVVLTLGASWRSNRTRDEVRALGLAERIKVLEWGKVFDGQQFHGTVDGVHPLPLPGNWVYSNSASISLRCSSPILGAELTSSSGFARPQCGSISCGATSISAPSLGVTSRASGCCRAVLSCIERCFLSTFSSGARRSSFRKLAVVGTARVLQPSFGTPATCA